jgi:hypothetical protein
MSPTRESTVVALTMATHPRNSLSVSTPRQWEGRSTAKEPMLMPLHLVKESTDCCLRVKEVRNVLAYSLLKSSQLCLLHVQEASHRTKPELQSILPLYSIYSWILLITGRIVRALRALIPLAIPSSNAWAEISWPSKYLLVLKVFHRSIIRFIETQDRIF